MKIGKWVINHRHSVAIGVIIFIMFAIITVSFFTAKTYMQAENSEPMQNIEHDRGEFGENITVHDSVHGEIIIRPSSNNEERSGESAILVNPMKITSDPETIWEDNYAYAGNFTLTEEVRMKNDAIGALSIPAIKLSANVYESPDEMEDMRKGIAHFPSTSAFEGNVGLSAHNINLDGNDGLFKNLFMLKKGDIISYKTALGKKTYSVNSVTTISENDWSPLSYADDNRLTLITCISGQKDKRLCVQALETVQ